MADIKCKKCGAEYPEEWGICQCEVVGKKVKVAKSKKDK